MFKTNYRVIHTQRSNFVRLVLSYMWMDSKTLPTMFCHDPKVLYAIWTASVCGLVLRKTSPIRFTLFLKSWLILSWFPQIFFKSCISFHIVSWHWTHLREKSVPVAIASLNGVNIKTGAMCRLHCCSWDEIAGSKNMSNGKIMKINARIFPKQYPTNQCTSYGI